MVKFVGMLSLVVLSLAACGGGTSESPVEAACQPRTVTFEAATDGSPRPTPVLPDDDEGSAAAIADSFCSTEWEVRRTRRHQRGRGRHEQSCPATTRHVSVTSWSRWLGGDRGKGTLGWAHRPGAFSGSACRTTIEERQIKRRGRVDR